MEQIKRNWTYDFTRAFAIISVVFCHSIESVYYIFQDRSILYSGLSFQSKIFDLLGITFGRLGVPLFLFLTGVLICNKEFNNEEDLKKFYKRKFIPLLITLEIWFIIWNVFIAFYFNWRGEVSNISLFSLFQNILLLKKVDYILPAWYAPLILGIYLIIPFISIIIKKINYKFMKWLILIGVTYFFIIPSINLILNTFGVNIIGNIDFYFSDGIYGHYGIYILYVILGFYIGNGLLKNIKKVTLYIIFFISFISCVVLQYCLTINDIFYKLGYENIFLFIACCALFELFRRLPVKGKVANLFIKLSKISFPIFLIHNLIQYIIYQSNIFSDFIRPLNVICNFILTMIITVLIIKILSLNKYTKKYLLKV